MPGTARQLRSSDRFPPAWHEPSILRVNFSIISCHVLCCLTCFSQLLDQPTLRGKNLLRKKRLLQMRTPSGSGSLSAADARFLGIHHDELKLGHLELDPLLSEFTFDQKSSGHILYIHYIFMPIKYVFFCIIIYKLSIYLYNIYIYMSSATIAITIIMHR